MHAFMMVDLQDLLHMTDIEESAGGNIAGGGNGGNPFGGANEWQTVQSVKSGVGGRGWWIIEMMR